MRRVLNFWFLAGQEQQTRTGNFGRKFTESAKKNKPIQLVKLSSHCLLICCPSGDEKISSNRFLRPKARAEWNLHRTLFLTAA